LVAELGAAPSPTVNCDPLDVPLRIAAATLIFESTVVGYIHREIVSGPETIAIGVLVPFMVITSVEPLNEREANSNGQSAKMSANFLIK
jgi:hypothetical protein